MHKAIVETTKNGTVYKNLDLKKLEVNDKIKFTMSFDEPITGQGKFGEWQLYKVNLKSINEEGVGEDVSFFANGRTKDYQPLGEVLKRFRSGDEVVLVKRLGTSNKGRPFFYWELENDKQPETLKNDEEKPFREEEIVVEELIDKGILSDEGAREYLSGKNFSEELITKSIELLRIVRENL